MLSSHLGIGMRAHSIAASLPICILTISLPSSETYDLERTLRMAGYGLLVVGQSLHFWFGFVSKLLPKRDLFTTFKRILMGENSAEIIAWLKRDSLPTMINRVVYWPVCDFVAFKFILVRLQPLVNNSFSSVGCLHDIHGKSRESMLLQLMGSMLTTSFLQQNYVS
ncbi:hypothetical protein SADUNF_Sadunf16G0178700 [Salix dunnii]|uniref:Uncharacterized protein n=1 Tax=Salix dunnii TaxID=1413687 RepID=A0A835J9E0_9ROSI|nr:hypothetical protein SADUNF_Sadunf16G0178700 [Salix dunnii]